MVRWMLLIGVGHDDLLEYKKASIPFKSLVSIVQRESRYVHFLSTCMNLVHWLLPDSLEYASLPRTVREVLGYYKAGR